MARRKVKPAQEAPIDPAELAASYMFPELFADEPLVLRSKLATERPFQPSAAVQFTIPDLPPVDWEHIRRKHAEQRRVRRVGAARRSAPQPPAIFTTLAEPPSHPRTMQGAIDAAIARQITAIRECISTGASVADAIAEAKAQSTLGSASWRRITDAIEDGQIPEEAR